MPTSYSWPLAAPSPPSPSTPLNSDAYARQLSALLPRGSAWLLDAGSWISKVLLALSDELSRVDGRAVNVLTEADPRTANETLDDWERVLGLPDSCIIAIPATTAERQVAITQKMVKQGGQRAAYYVQLALACGYSATVTEGAYPPLRVGFRCGARCYGTDWAFVWVLNVSPPTGTALSHAELECIISRVAPAHTAVHFVYL